MYLFSGSINGKLNDTNRIFIVSLTYLVDTYLALLRIFLLFNYILRRYNQPVSVCIVISYLQSYK
jgi:hypothetical protein